MLADPKWNAPSLPSFIGWLETKNPSHGYDFGNCEGRCLMGQYMEAMGIAWPETGLEWQEPYLDTMQQVLGNRPSILWTRPWTYGAALERARKLVPAHV